MRMGNHIEAVQKEHWFMASGVPCIITLTVPSSLSLIGDKAQIQSTIIIFFFKTC